jgi:hypothetical protein
MDGVGLDRSRPAPPRHPPKHCARRPGMGFFGDASDPQIPQRHWRIYVRNYGYGVAVVFDLSDAS